MTASKRPRFGASATTSASRRVSSAYDAAFESAPSDPSTRAFADALDVRVGPLGATPRPGSCMATAVEAHAGLRNGDVVALRVGEVYEFYGADALVAATATPLACSLRPADLKCVVFRTKLHVVLTALVARGWRVAVHEESEVVCTPRIRVLRKIVTDASPTYPHAFASKRGGGGGARAAAVAEGADATRRGEEEDEDAVAACPVLGLHARVDGTYDAVEMRLDRREVVLHTQVSKAHVEALVPGAARPVACLHAVPAFVAPLAGGGGAAAAGPASANGPRTCVLGSGPEGTLASRMGIHVKHQYMVDASGFRTVRADDRGCAPMPRYTLENLGMCDDGRTPSLLDACCTKRACAAVREQMSAWLRHPPSPSSAVREAVERMRANVAHPLPRAVPLRRAKWRAHAAAREGGCDVGHLSALHFNARHAVLAEEGIGRAGPRHEQLFRLVAASVGCGESVRTLNVAGLMALTSTVFDGQGCIQATLLSKYDEDVAGRAADLEAWKGRQGYGSYTVLHGRIALYGRPDGEDRLVFRDRTNRLVPERHTTRELEEAQDALEGAERARDVAEEELLADLAEAVTRTYDAAATVANAYATAVATLADHVRAVGRTWNPVASAEPERCERAGDAEEEGDRGARQRGGEEEEREEEEGSDAARGGSLTLRGFWPYWLPDGVRNTVRVAFGTPVVLTGPNGGGKSTVLRALCAAALLGQVGLLVPAEGGEVPSFSHIFLRAGSQDCATEGRSAFAAEMADLSTVLAAARDALVLLDEPCRGTSASEGGTLLSAYVAALPQSATTVLSTHFLELECPGGERMQMVAGVDHATAACCPEFRLTTGRCTNSLALHCALASGMPCDVVADARSPDDEETAALIALRAAGIACRRMTDARAMVPPGIAHAVYVLVTDEGVYVGEARDLQDRLRTHSSTKEIRSVLYTSVDNRSDALALEATLIRRMGLMNVRLLSVADGRHSCT